MILFTVCMIYLQEYYMMGMGEENPEMYKHETKEKFPVWLPSYPPVYEMEAGCFPVFQNTENKSDPS